MLSSVFRFISVRCFGNASKPCPSLSNLKPSAGSHKKAKRKGRGIAAHGHLCGRGANGQKSRSGGTPGPAFTGGQTPFHLSVPKRGHHNPNEKDFAEVNLDRLQHLVETGRLDPTRPITIKSMMEAGIKDFGDGIKILAGGHEHLRWPLEIHATRFTDTAIKAIEQAGGRALAVYHSPEDLRRLRDPERAWRKDPVAAMKQFTLPRRLKDQLFYRDPNERGYLAPGVSLSEAFKRIYEMPQAN